MLVFFGKPEKVEKPNILGRGDSVNGALQHIKILDLSRVLAGPFCTMILGDLGAEVIKVEAPSGSDDTQMGTPFKNGVSAYYLCANRNKSITADLKAMKGLKSSKSSLKNAM